MKGISINGRKLHEIRMPAEPYVKSNSIVSISYPKNRILFEQCGEGMVKLTIPSGRGPKGGVDQKIPMNETARGIFKSVVKTGSEYIFPGRGGGQRTTIGRIGQRITKRAGLPQGFRPLHGLRHVYASMLASSGKVDMYVLQRLMTHKSPKMTQRYAHLRDDALKAGAGQIDEIMKQANEVLTPITGKKIVNLK